MKLHKVVYFTEEFNNTTYLVFRRCFRGCKRYDYDIGALHNGAMFSYDSDSTAPTRADKAIRKFWKYTYRTQCREWAGCES